MKMILFLALTFASIKGMPNCNVSNLDQIRGSWINNQMYEYYKSAKTNPCNEKFFERSNSVPLYLSFNEKKQIEITFRYEQKIGIYHIKSSVGDSIIAYKDRRVLKIKLMKDLLVMEYEGRTVSFKKVSSSYSNDVFGEFVKSLVFENHNSYTIESFNENKKFNNRIVDRGNFRQTLKEVFACEFVNFAQLGLFKYGDYCLPELALYYKNKDSSDGPKLLGINTEYKIVKFINSSGEVVLRLKSKE